MTPLAKQLLHKDRLKNERTYAGHFGECLFELWMKNKGWELASVEQSPGTKPERLKKFKGKRPDFFLENWKNDETFVFFDAKCYLTTNCTEFTLKKSELEGLKNFKVWFETDSELNVQIFFPLFPKEEQGFSLIWVLLEEFETGMQTTIFGELAVQISLQTKDIGCFDNLTKEMVDGAVVEATRRFELDLT